MRRPRVLQVLAPWLILALAVQGAPAYALRPESGRQATGPEEDLTRALRPTAPPGHEAAGVEERRIEVYDREGHLHFTWHGGRAMSGQAAEQLLAVLRGLGHATVRGLRLAASGALAFGGQKGLAQWTTAPNVPVQLELEHGHVAAAWLLQEAPDGTVRRARMGFGHGQGQRRFFPREVAVAEALARALQTSGLMPEQAAAAAQTLVRLKEESLALLQRDGMLTEADAAGLRDLTLTSAQITALAGRLANEQVTYSARLQAWILPNGVSPAQFIEKVVKTHLLPWATMERLQRTYGLGRNLSLIYQALGYPDVEAWIQRTREVAARRGRLNPEHLTRYDPAQTPSGQDPAVWTMLKAQLTVLQALAARTPEEPSGPINRQRRLIQNWLAQLTQSRGQTTGVRVFDRLLGLASLTNGAPAVPPVTTLMDQEIPRSERQWDARLGMLVQTGDEAQETAVRLAFERPRILFIEGPPGTGKTKVIAEILRQAVSRGQKVLLTSQMHQAVDNALVYQPPGGILPRIMDALPVLRLGNDPANFRYGTEAVWPGTRQTGFRRDVAVEFSRRRRAQQGGFVLAATTSGLASDSYFNEALVDRLEAGFDLVIMDEASRATLSEAFDPLRYLAPHGKVIFVGDTRQLPPFGITDDERRAVAAAGVPDAAIAQYNTSVLEWLLARGYGDRILLQTNYRSHPLLAGLVSHLSYDDAIAPRGWEDFDAETLSLRVIDLAEDPDVYHERRGPNGSVLNAASAEKVVGLVRLYQRRGIPLDQITVITPYRAQVELLERQLQAAFPKAATRPVVTTVDGYQGGENRAIILDLVRSNPQRQIGFVKDLRRLNVALSRAQDNLAIIWDSRTFTGAPDPTEPEADQQARRFFQKLLDYYEREVQTFFPEPAPLDGTGLEEPHRAAGLLWQA